ncbi:uncharacterized protein LOC110847198 isoform X2 [Folsomia candida]|uniref:uncharacterized protein LOC110847198 isoform X2 n=1 Tax=Folsomia candida TaxID=158441 RepID=UPI000B901BEB|nr:uncharacterized protein LOC110847198 isoform X2 [Folsomia candida]
MGQSSKSKYSINPILFSMILCAGISGINSSEANGSGKVLALHSKTGTQIFMAFPPQQRLTTPTVIPSPLDASSIATLFRDNKTATHHMSVIISPSSSTPLDPQALAGSETARNGNASSFVVHRVHHQPRTPLLYKYLPFLQKTPPTNFRHPAIQHNPNNLIQTSPTMRTVTRWKITRPDGSLVVEDHASEKGKAVTVTPEISNPPAQTSSSLVPEATSSVKAQSPSPRPHTRRRPPSLIQRYRHLVRETHAKFEAEQIRMNNKLKNPNYYNDPFAPRPDHHHKNKKPYFTFGRQNQFRPHNNSTYSFREHDRSAITTPLPRRPSPPTPSIVPKTIVNYVKYPTFEDYVAQFVPTTTTPPPKMQVEEQILDAVTGEGHDISVPTDNNVHPSSSIIHQNFQYPPALGRYRNYFPHANSHSYAPQGLMSHSILPSYPRPGHVEIPNSKMDSVIYKEPQTVIHHPTVYITNDAGSAISTGRRRRPSIFKTVKNFIPAPFFKGEDIPLFKGSDLHGLVQPVVTNHPQPKFFSNVEKSVDTTWSTRKALQSDIAKVLTSRLRLGGTIVRTGTEILSNVIEATAALKK